MTIWGCRCFHCEGRLGISHHGYCCRCYREIKRPHSCARCGMPLPHDEQGCGYCLQNEVKWHSLVQGGAYQPPLSHWIHQFKYQQGFYLDQPLARLLLLAILQAKRERGLILPEVILPVPLFWQRHWRRGYNQGELISRFLAKWLDIPLDRQSLIRQQATPPQQGLDAAARRRNLRGAFTYQPQKAYQRVAVVDDVLTTGSTLNSICTELLKAGVKEIQVWVVARA
ncbi:competence protein ComF [Pasteurellaceae bacterium Macca]|nr:competence protein ComF [Pasteurellaceae bacterium Macca]